MSEKIVGFGEENIKMPEQRTDKKRCFIITPIGNDNDSIRRHIDGIIDAAIKPALEPDYEVVAAHKITETGTITKQIIKEIYQDELAIANLTGNNPNVMYELAVRYCLGKPVLTIAEKGTSLPFDVMPERTIFYINDPQGSLDLKEAIKSYVLNIDLTRVESPIHAILKEIDADAEALSLVKSSLKEATAQDSTSEILMHILNKLDRLEKITERSQVEKGERERGYRYACEIIMENFDPKIVEEEKRTSLAEKLIDLPFPLRLREYSFSPNLIEVAFEGSSQIPSDSFKEWLKIIVETSGLGEIRDVRIRRMRIS